MSGYERDAFRSEAAVTERAKKLAEEISTFLGNSASNTSPDNLKHAIECISKELDISETSFKSYIESSKEYFESLSKTICADLKKSASKENYQVDLKFPNLKVGCVNVFFDEKKSCFEISVLDKYVIEKVYQLNSEVLFDRCSLIISEIQTTLEKKDSHISAIENIYKAWGELEPDKSDIPINLLMLLTSTGGASIKKILSSHSSAKKVTLPRHSMAYILASMKTKTKSGSKLKFTPATQHTAPHSHLSMHLPSNTDPTKLGEGTPYCKAQLVS